MTFIWCPKSEISLLSYCFPPHLWVLVSLDSCAHWTVEQKETPVFWNFLLMLQLWCPLTWSLAFAGCIPPFPFVAYFQSCAASPPICPRSGRGIPWFNWLWWRAGDFLTLPSCSWGQFGFFLSLHHCRVSGGMAGDRKLRRSSVDHRKLRSALSVTLEMCQDLPLWAGQ